MRFGIGLFAVLLWTAPAACAREGRQDLAREELPSGRAAARELRGLLLSWSPAPVDLERGLASLDRLEELLGATRGLEAQEKEEGLAELESLRWSALREAPARAEPARGLLDALEQALEEDELDDDRLRRSAAKRALVRAKDQTRDGLGALLAAGPPVPVGPAIPPAPPVLPAPVPAAAPAPPVVVLRVTLPNPGGAPLVGRLALPATPPRPGDPVTLRLDAGGFQTHTWGAIAGKLGFIDPLPERYGPLPAAPATVSTVPKRPAPARPAPLPEVPIPSSNEDISRLMLGRRDGFKAAALAIPEIAAAIRADIAARRGGDEAAEGGIPLREMLYLKGADGEHLQLVALAGDLLDGKIAPGELPLRVDYLRRKLNEHARDCAQGQCTDEQRERLAQAQRWLGEHDFVRNAFVKKNMALAQEFVNRRSRSGEGRLTRAETMAAAEDGLWHAAELYNPGRGTQFSTHAFAHMLRAMQSLQESRNPISGRNPNRAREREAVWQEYGQGRSLADIAEKFSLEIDQVRHHLGIGTGRGSPVASLDRGVAGKDGPGETFGALLEDKRAPSPVAEAAASELRERIEEALKALVGDLSAEGASERKVFYLYSGLDGIERTLEETGEDLGVTRERVRQIYGRAKDNLLRNPRAWEILSPYLKGDGGASSRRPPAPRGRDPRLLKSVAELGLEQRQVNMLTEEGIHTVGDLLGHTPAQLRAVPQLGEKSVAQIFAALEAIGFRRGGARSVPAPTPPPAPPAAPPAAPPPAPSAETPSPAPAGPSAGPAVPALGSRLRLSEGGRERVGVVAASVRLDGEPLLTVRFEDGGSRSYPWRSLAGRARVEASQALPATGTRVQVFDGLGGARLGAIGGTGTLGGREMVSVLFDDYTSAVYRWSDAQSRLVPAAAGSVRAPRPRHPHAGQKAVLRVGRDGRQEGTILSVGADGAVTLRLPDGSIESMGRREFINRLLLFSAGKIIGP